MGEPIIQNSSLRRPLLQVKFAYEISCCWSRCAQPINRTKFSTNIERSTLASDKEFVQSLWNKYHDTFEEPIQSIRRSWYDFPVGSEKWIQLARRGARLEWDYGELLATGVSKYHELNRWLLVKYARQCSDEYKHYSLIADFLKSLGHDIEDPYTIPETPVRKYYGRLLSGKFDFMLFGLAEKVSDNTYREYSEVTNNPQWKEVTRIFNRDEIFHLSFLNERLRLLSQNEEDRELVDRYFHETWKESLRGNIVSFHQLGVDVKTILKNYPSTLDYISRECPEVAMLIKS